MSTTFNTALNSAILLRRGPSVKPKYTPQIGPYLIRFSGDLMPAGTAPVAVINIEGEVTLLDPQFVPTSTEITQATTWLRRYTRSVMPSEPEEALELILTNAKMGIELSAGESKYAISVFIRGSLPNLLRCLRACEDPIVSKLLLATESDDQVMIEELLALEQPWIFALLLRLNQKATLTVFNRRNK